MEPPPTECLLYSALRPININSLLAKNKRAYMLSYFESVWTWPDQVWLRRHTWVSTLWPRPLSLSSDNDCSHFVNHEFLYKWKLTSVCGWFYFNWMD